jgi:acetylornithine/succinyldiaminopimelate/putrescine aminotransferase
VGDHQGGIAPDILVTGKGISGGIYPIACVLVSERCAGWLTEDGFGHISTFGGAELGCIAAIKALEICSRDETRSMVHYISDFIGRGLREIQSIYPDWFIGHSPERRGDGPGVRRPDRVPST